MMSASAVAEPSQQIFWHSLSAAEALRLVDGASDGLTDQEALRRRAANGPNELNEVKAISPFAIFFGQFKSLIVWILIAAGIISALLGEYIDASVILLIVILNAVIGFYQEFKAENSIAALKKMTAPQANVLRDGQHISIAASEIVVGDILLLEAGDLVAADARLLESASLRCIEAALTGESVAVAKKPDAMDHTDVLLGDRENMVFMGTGIAAGTARSVVVATAMDTELGHIAGLISDAGTEQRTPLEKKLESFGRVLIWATFGIVALVFGLGLLRGTDLFELFMSAVSLAVAAVPEGLPAIVTVALGLGVVRMSRRRALVRRLPAVETLGSTTVICTDKTGTLTLGEMTVRALFVADKLYDVTGEGYGPEGEIRYNGARLDGEHAAPLLELSSVLIGCNNAHRSQEEGQWRTIGDPTEGAMLTAGIKAGGDQNRIEHEMPKLEEFPFDSDRKMSSMIRSMPDGTLRVFTNGAPGILLKKCAQLYTGSGIRPMTEEDRTRILAQTSAMAKKSLRVLGSAHRSIEPASVGTRTADAVENDLTFVGLSGMYDPPRQEAKEAIARCRNAGIRVVMITGDHPETATAIAHEIGIADENNAAVSGIELEKMSDAELRNRVSAISVYARVTAGHKLRIVRAWKENHAVVAMTGDGVNDAPAIKGADIGIAMGRTGTEVTKQASDMIITDDNFVTIVSAVEEGRGIYDNIRKTLQYLLAGNTGELLLMTVCVVIGYPVPLLPIHLLWINLVTDGMPAVALVTDPVDPDVMNRNPRPRLDRITNRSFLRTMVTTGFLTAGVAFTVYVVMLQSHAVEIARTYAFTVLVFAELLRSFGARSETKPVWRISLLTNISLVAVVAVTFGLQLLSQHIEIFGRFLKTSSMPVSDWFLLLAVGAIPLLMLEAVKVVRNARRQAIHKKESI